MNKHLGFFFLVVLAFTGCATTPSTDSTDATVNAPPIPPGTAEAPAVAACRVFIPGEDPLEFDECVESVASDGTLILKPSTMTFVEKRLAAEKKANGTKHLWMMLTKEKSANVIFGGPIVAYIGKGPSGVNLARQVAFFDNGPDFFESGLARSIAKNGKVGFIDETLATMIREEYDYATQFQKGLALACNGCTSEPAKGDEHSTVVGGDWRVLNKFGKVLKGPGLSQTEAYDAVDALTKKSPATPPAAVKPTPAVRATPSATATPAPSSKEAHP